MNNTEYNNNETGLPYIPLYNNNDMASANNAKQNLIKSLVKMSAAAVSVIMLLVFGTISWFTGSRENQVGGMSMRASYERGYVVNDYKAYKYNLTSNSCVEITDYSNGLLLNEYDTVFTDRNENTGILMKIVITGEVEEGNNAKLALDRSINHSNNNNYVYVSKIAYFQCVLESSCQLEQYNNNLNDLWSHAKDYFNGNSAPQKLKFSNDSEQSIDLINFTQENSRGTVIWLYMDYDTVAVSEAMANRSFTLNDSAISVFKDCDQIRVVPQTQTP